MIFEEANKVIHFVEKQWHYPILTEFGFEPIDKEGIGFVRSYRYEKVGSDKSPNIIICTTGCNSDYWQDKSTKKEGCWSDLRPYLNKLSKIQ